MGILAKGKPRLITTLFLREVPAGTNGGMSLLGTIASALGGAFIGIVSLTYDYMIMSTSLQYVLFVASLGLTYGLLGSMLDSLLGATVQATYYSYERKCIIKSHDLGKNINDSSIRRICGIDILTNEAVNAVSIAMVMISSIWISPWLYGTFFS